MPFYEYQCGNCGHELEAMQKVSDAPLKKCPECGKTQLQRLISAPVFRLKGGGWYETDFKDDKDKKRNLADRTEEASKEEKKTGETGAKSDAPVAESDKKDSKSDAKTDEKPLASKPVKGKSNVAARRNRPKKRTGKRAKRR